MYFQRSVEVFVFVFLLNPSSLVRQKKFNVEKKPKQTNVINPAPVLSSFFLLAAIVLNDSPPPPVTVFSRLSLQPNNPPDTEAPFRPLPAVTRASLCGAVKEPPSLISLGTSTCVTRRRTDPPSDRRQPFCVRRRERRLARCDTASGDPTPPRLTGRSSSPRGRCE